MKKIVVLIFLVLVYLTTNSCKKKTYILRSGVDGRIYDRDTKKPIDSVIVRFINGFYSVWFSKEEKKHITNNEGYFKMEPLTVIRSYVPARNEKFDYANYLKIKKKDILMTLFLLEIKNIEKTPKNTILI